MSRKLAASIRALFDDLTATVFEKTEPAMTNPATNIVGIVRSLPFDEVASRHIEGISTALAESVDIAAIEKEVVLSSVVQGTEMTPAQGFAAAYALENTGDLIVNVVDAQRRVISTAVARSIADGVNPRTVARVVRQTVGLLPRQEKTIARLRERLTSQGKKESAVDATITRRRRQLLEQRVKVITRTELSRAQNAGQLNEWFHEQRIGNVSTRVRKKWFTNDPCPICVELGDRDSILMSEAFFSSILRRSFMHPPAHPNCRCALVLRRPK